LAEASLRHLGVPPTITPRPPVLVASAPREAREAPPGEAKPASARSTALLQVRQSSATEGLMPDLHGLSAREALRTLAQIGLAARLTGNGFVVDQRPAPGVPLERGETCELTLNRLNTTTAPASSRGTSP
jgi:hypothetical protein